MEVKQKSEAPQRKPRPHISTQISMRRPLHPNHTPTHHKNAMHPGVRDTFFFVFLPRQFLNAFLTSPDFRTTTTRTCQQQWLSCIRKHGCALEPTALASQTTRTASPMVSASPTGLRMSMGTTSRSEPFRHSCTHISYLHATNAYAPFLPDYTAPCKCPRSRSGPPVHASTILTFPAIPPHFPSPPSLHL